MVAFRNQISDILESSRTYLSDIMPSQWAEENIIMPPPREGPLRYQDTTPYTREIIDRFSPTDPSREIAVMGAAQFGKTKSIIIPVIGWIIKNDPGNIIMTVGHESLVPDAMESVDAMLDSTGLRKLIKSSALRAKNQKTGDTNTIKEFPRGKYKLSPASNPKIWRQENYKYGLIDDYEAVRSSSKIAGNTRLLINKRFTAYNKTKKILYVSSPELEEKSNIYEVYKLGDQRKFMVPCPCCGVSIELLWETETKDKQPAGITWQLDNEGLLIPDSVGYTCQECGDFFTDQHKSEIVSKGYWQPTAKPWKPTFVSYQMNCLYSPHFMTDWKSYVYEYLDCFHDGVRDEEKYQTFLNLNLGLPYKKPGEAPKANQLQKNTYEYQIGSIPEKLSEKHGNGKIILLTLAADCNGLEEDARLDWEIVGWTESGASYSIDHGSIGTFIPKEGSKKNKVDRIHWTYEHGKSFSVWPEFEKIMDRIYQTDTGRRMKAAVTGVDTGHYTSHVYAFIDKMSTNHNIIGLKGKDIDKYTRLAADQKTFKNSLERPNKLYLVQVGMIKDKLAQLMKLRYDPGNDDAQPPGFMNYPYPAEGKYQFKNFFEHYESEHRTENISNGLGVAYRWEKINSGAQNHFWDVRVYNMALKDILLHQFCKDAGLKNYDWSDFVDLILGRKKN